MKKVPTLDANNKIFGKFLPTIPQMQSEQLANELKDSTGVVGRALDDSGPGLIAYASNNTTTVSDFTQTAIAVPHVAISVPSTNGRSFAISWSATMQLIEPPVGNDGMLVSILYEYPAGVVIQGSQYSQVLEGQDLLYVTQVGKCIFPPSSQVRQFYLGALSNKVSGTSYPKGRISNGFGGVFVKSWMMAEVL